MIISPRKQMQLAQRSAEMYGVMRKLWKQVRKYPDFLSDIYNKLCLVADKKGVVIPSPRIDMQVTEQWNKN